MIQRALQKERTQNGRTAIGRSQNKALPMTNPQKRLPVRSSRNVLWAIAQKNGIMWHIRHALLKKRLFLSNARLVSNSEVAEQDYNLSVSTYVEQEDKREVVNITELNAEIGRIVAREDVLRREIAAIVASLSGRQAEIENSATDCCTNGGGEAND
jgi:type I restriction-modification system DNA methylase subunit